MSEGNSFVFPKVSTAWLNSREQTLSVLLRRRKNNNIHTTIIFHYFLTMRKVFEQLFRVACCAKKCLNE
jgi:hypothetical protein